MSVRCTKCGDIRREAKERNCPTGGACEYAKTLENPLAWLTCPHRDPVPLTKINGRVAGYGCASASIEVYRCKQFAEPVIKQGHPPCLDTLREQVPGATGRTCRECPVPREAGALAGGS